MPNKVEIRNEKTKFDLYVDKDIPDYFVDGLGQLMVGANVTKVVFYTSWGHDSENVEERHANLRISIPTLALLDLVNQVVKNTRPHKEFIVNELGNIQVAVKERLDSFDFYSVDKQV